MTTALNTGGTRNDILNGVLSFFADVAPFVTVTRQIKLFADVPVIQRPWLGILKTGEERSYDAGDMALLTILVELFIYTNATVSNNGGVPPSQQLENILDVVDVQLRPSPFTNRQTLNGLVHHCRIEGKTVTVPGDLDGEGIMIIPLKILIPS